MGEACVLQKYAVQSTNHMMRYDSVFGPNYSSSMM